MGKPTHGPGGGLLERGEELSALAAAIDAAGAGDGRLVLIDGVAGCGKSRLLDASVGIGAAAGLRVLRAECSELEVGFPFGMALALFEPALVAMTPGEREQALSGSGRLAAPLFSGAPGAWTASGQDGVLPVAHGLYWLTASLCSAGGLVVVDDAHWCDDASLRFLAYLARRLEGLPVAVLAALRPDEPRAAATADLYANPRSVVLRPAPLSDEAVAVLVRECVSADAEPEFCAGCSHVTGGNPFLVHELLSEIVADGIAPNAAGAARLERLAPESVLRAVIARVANLPAGSSEFARAAAVLADGATVDRCARVAGLDVPVAERAVDALAGVGVLGGGPGVTFAHPLIRSSVESEIPPATLARAHHDAARILHEDGGRAEVVAAHLLLAAGGGGEQWEIDTLREAARRELTRGEPRKAVAMLARAQAARPPSADVKELLVELGHAQALAADPDALDTLQDAIDHTDGLPERVALRRRRGDLLFAQNRLDEAVAEYERGMSELDAASPEARELQAARAAAQAIAPGGLEKALAGVAAIVERPGADTAGERALLAHVAMRRAFTGEPREQTRALAMRAWADGALLDDEGPDGQLWSLVTAALSSSGFFSESVAVANRVVEAAQRAGSVFAFATASYCRAYPLYFQAQISAATADAQRALDATDDGWSAWLGATSFVLARCLLERGELDNAEAVLEDADEPRWAQSIEGLMVLDGRAWMHLANGRSQQALADYLTLGERSEGVFGLISPVWLPWQNGAALAALRLGDAARARELNAAGTELAERLGAPGPIGRSRWIAGLIQGGTQGIALMGDAVDLLADTDAVLEHLYALVELGAALRRSNRRADARAPLINARELAHELGASALQARANSELLATGARPRRIMRTGADSLTPSERRIADHAARGMTNRQIAETLFITTKAVEFHLANAYRKLSIRGRRELDKALQPSHPRPNAEQESAR